MTTRKSILSVPLALMLTSSIVCQARTADKVPAENTSGVRASFNFSTGDAITANEKIGSDYGYPKNEPGEICVKQLRGIEINDGWTVDIRSSETQDIHREIRYSWSHVYPYSDGHVEVAYMYDVLGRRGTNTPNLTKTCSVVGLATDTSSGKIYLSHHWVNIATNVPLSGYANFTPIISSSNSLFGALLNVVSLGLSDVVSGTAQAVSDSLESAINRRIAASNGNLMSEYNSIALELMLMMCDVQAVQLNDQACKGSNLHADKYISQLKDHYNSFISEK